MTAVLPVGSAFCCSSPSAYHLCPFSCWSRVVTTTTIAMARARHQPVPWRQRSAAEPRPRFRRLDVPQYPWRCGGVHFWLEPEGGHALSCLDCSGSGGGGGGRCSAS